LLVALGFLSLCLQLVWLIRPAWERRHFTLVEHTDTWTGGRYQARVRRGDEGPPALEALPDAGVPVASPAQFALAAAACIVALAAFFPQIVNASEASIHYHHLDHAAHFFL